MDDLISRQAAINTVLNIRQKCDTNDIDEYRDILVECFEELPAAEKRGEWISHEGYEECSQCGKFTAFYSRFCPNCGARMEE